MSTPNKNIIEVVYNDGTNSRFEIKAPSITRLFKFADLIVNRDSFGVVVLGTGQPDVHVDRLSPESFGILSATIWDRYLPDLVQLAKSDASLGARVFPVLAEIIKVFGAQKPAEQSQTAETAAA